MSDILKKSVAHFVLKYIPKNIILGVGSGSTVNYFIKALSTIRSSIIGAVSSSIASEILLKNSNIPIFHLNDINYLDLYIDSTDQINKNMEMIKGKGGALTREKIIASFSKKFICIAEDSKYVDQFFNCPVPIEIIPMALNYVTQEVIKLGGFVNYRKDFVSDNGNYIIDVYDLNFKNPSKLENLLNNIPGVVTVGLFCFRKADLLLLATKNEIKIINQFD